MGEWGGESLRLMRRLTVKVRRRQKCHILSLVKLLNFKGFWHVQPVFSLVPIHQSALLMEGGDGSQGQSHWGRWQSILWEKVKGFHPKWQGGAKVVWPSVALRGKRAGWMSAEPSRRHKSSEANLRTFSVRISGEKKKKLFFGTSLFVSRGVSIKSNCLLFLFAYGN